MGRTKLHSTGRVTNFPSPRALPRGEEEEEEDDDNVGPDFSFGQFRRALNRSMASSRTNQREMDSWHFGSGIRIDEGRERRHREDVHVGGAANTTTLILNVYNNGGFLSERKECPWLIAGGKRLAPAMRVNG